jgi:hypothetical protein
LRAWPWLPERVRRIFINFFCKGEYRNAENLPLTTCEQQSFEAQGAAETLLRNATCTSIKSSLMNEFNRTPIA